MADTICLVDADTIRLIDADTINSSCADSTTTTAATTTVAGSRLPLNRRGPYWEQSDDAHWDRLLREDDDLMVLI